MNSTNINSQVLPTQLSSRQAILRIAPIALAYFFAHWLAFLFPDAEQVLMAIWPAGGIGLAAFLLNPRQLWPAIAIALFVSGNSANLLAGRPAIASVGFMTANVLESLACAWLLLHSCGKGVRFNRVKEILALIAAAALVNAGTSFIGAGTATLASGAPFWNFWVTWWIADGLGILLVTPLIVSWVEFRGPSSSARWSRAIELGAFLVLWCTVAWLLFTAIDISQPFAPQPYMLAALLAWPALRFKQRDVVLALVILAGIAITSTVVSTGMFPLGGKSPTERLLMVQAFLGIMAASGMLLTASYTEAKSAERVSREGQAQLRALGDNLPNGMVYQVVRERDGKTRFLYVSAGVERLNGVSAEEVLRDSSALYDLILGEDRSMVAAAEEASVKDMSVFNVVARFRRPDGQIRWMHLSSSPHRLANGRIIWSGIQLDITERVQTEAVRQQAEEALRLSEEKFSKAFYISPDAVNINRSADGLFIAINQGFTQLTGYAAEEVEGKSSLEIDIWANPDDRARLVQGLREHGKVTNLEAQFRLKDGSVRTGLMSAAPIVVDGEPCILSITRDIHERKQAEKQLEKALAEKETLLRELYHRTKNNMQVISALLDLQSAHIDDERLQAILADTKNRIRSMALVHQKLYEAQDLSHVNLKEYIGDLVKLLMESYRVSPGRLSLVSEVDDVLVLIDTAIPCGLIMNELISNALKHAFPANRTGEIKVQLGRTESGEIQLRVADDGVGVPPGFDFRRDGRLGLQNIFALGESQLNGQVAFDAVQGVACQIQFRDDLYTPRV